MAFVRQSRRTEIGPNRYRYRVVVTGDNCAPGSHEAMRQYHLFMRTIADQPHLLACGYGIPSRISITHNGGCWQAEAEAEGEEHV